MLEPMCIHTFETYSTLRCGTSVGLSAPACRNTRLRRSKKAVAVHYKAASVTGCVCVFVCVYIHPASLWLLEKTRLLQKKCTISARRTVTFLMSSAAQIFAKTPDFHSFLQWSLSDFSSLTYA